MLEYARQSMCDYLSQTQPAPARLDDFNVFKKGNAAFTYGNFYNSYEMCTEPEPDADNVYYNLLNFRDYRHDAGNWRSKVMDQWNPDDTVEWVYDCALSCGFNELDIPFHNFRIYGSELRNMTRLDIIGLVAHHHQDSEISNTIGNTIYNRLEEIRRSVLKYADSSSQIHSHEQTMTNLDDWRGTASDYKPNNINLMPANYGDDYEDPSRYTASPADSAGSDGSKSGDEDDKRKPSKRPPGRPKGTGTKKDKRPRNVSVPQFLRDLLLNERFCPSIIKWEDHSQGKFRFVKPDEVAKLWGQMKQNDNMTFEKFSRAMRYHYQHSVLVSVPTARLVYQFGPKGPEFKTSNPNFVKVKSELDSIHS